MGLPHKATGPEDHDLHFDNEPGDTHHSPKVGWLIQPQILSLQSLCPVLLPQSLRLMPQQSKSDVAGSPQGFPSPGPSGMSLDHHSLLH